MRWPTAEEIKLARETAELFALTIPKDCKSGKEYPLLGDFFANISPNREVKIFFRDPITKAEFYY